jgi:hypothetical protein
VSPEEARAICDDAVARLGEHFDAVQILACYLREDGETTAVRRGMGLWPARVGMAHAFIEQDRADDQAWAVAQELKKKEEE